MFEPLCSNNCLESYTLKETTVLINIHRVTPALSIQILDVILNIVVTRSIKFKIDVCGICRQPIVSYIFSLNKQQQMHVVYERRLSFTGLKSFPFLILYHSYI